MKISSFDPLFEYPEYNQTGTSAKATAAAKSVTAPGAKPSATPSASPNTSGAKPAEPKQPTVAKASELKKDFEFPDEKGNVLKIVSPAGEKTDLPNDMEDIVIAQDARKNIRVFDADADIALPQVEVEESANLDNILDRKKTNFAKKISRKQNKLKQLIRAAKFGNDYKEPVFEINFNSKEIIQNALDAPIQCGFEAETTWPDLDTTSDEPADLYGRDWSEIEEYIYDQEGMRGIDRVKNLYNDWLIQEVASDIEREIIDDLVRDRKEDEAYLDDYISDQIDMDDVEEYKDETLEDLRARARQGRMFDGGVDPQEELDERESWDDDAWAREYVEENYPYEFVEWLEEQIRDNGEAWDDAVQQAEETYDIDDWAQKEYSGNWYSLLDDANVQIWVLDEDGANNLDEVASNMEDWASNNSKSNDVRLGSYHSGKSVDNTYWRVEDDSSIEGEGAKAEIISPVYSTPREMLAEMKSLFEHFEDEGVETNSTTGLHVTMSFAGDYKETNRLVLATLLGDQYVLKQFDRQFNSYAKSQQQNIQYEIERMLNYGSDRPEDFDELYSILSRGIDSGKFNSINFKGGAKNSDGNPLIEFRIAGGSDYHSDYDKAAKAVIRYAATMNAASEDKPYNRQDFLKTVYRMINKSADDKLAPTRTDVNISLPDNDFVQAVREILNQTGDRLDAVETLDRAYKELANGDGVLAKEHFTEFMKSLLVSVKNREKVGGGFKIRPTSLLVRGFKQAMNEFGVSRDEIVRAVSQHYVKNADHIVNTTDLDIHDDFIVPTVAILDQILLKKNQPAPERGPSLGIPYVQDARVYLRRSAYAGQSQYDSNAPVDIDNDVKFVNNDDHFEIDKLISARNVLTGHPDLKNPNPELAADIQQKLEKVNTELANFEKVYGVKFASQYPPAGQEMDAFSHANSTDPVWQRHLRSKGIHLYQAESKTFDRFDAMPLAEQLALLAKVDKRKIDEIYKPYGRTRPPSEKEEFKRKELEWELRNEQPNNYAVYINGRKWKVVADRKRAEKMAQTLIRKGKDAKVHTTGEPVSEAEEPKDASARAKLDHSLRAQGHKVEKPKKGKGSFQRKPKHKGKLPEALSNYDKHNAIPSLAMAMSYDGKTIDDTDYMVAHLAKLGGDEEYAHNKLNNPEFMKALAAELGDAESGWDELGGAVHDFKEADQVKTNERKPKTVKPNTGHQSKHPYQGRLVGEGAVPETDFVQEYKQIMSRPLLGSDLMGQMRAFEIVPDPAMIREFRNQISQAGRDTDLRSVFKSFANAKLHPVQKKHVGLAETKLNEYTDIDTERENIIKILSNMDLADEQQAALVDKIFRILNSEHVNNTISAAFERPLEKEPMGDKEKEAVKADMARILASLDSDYASLNNFLTKLEKQGGVVDIAELSKPINTISGVLGGDPVALQALQALSNYGVGKKQKGPGEYALALLSDKIHLATGEGDLEIEGIGKVELKAALSSSGGRIGYGGGSQKAKRAVLDKYADHIPTVMQSIGGTGGSLGLPKFIQALNLDLPARTPGNRELRKAIATELLTMDLEGFAGPVIDAIATSENLQQIEDAYLSANYSWYKDRDDFDALLLMHIPNGKTSMINNVDDLIAFRRGGNANSTSISVIPTQAGAGREQWAQLTLNKSAL